MRNTIVIFSALCALCTFTLAGCGGGGGTAAVGTTVNRGVVTAEGNIAVNGVFYNISSANITIDGVVASKRDLKVGMLVTVKGVFDNRTSHAIRRTATSVQYFTNFRGPVDCVNPLNNSLTIMGQQVLIKSDEPNRTVFANFSTSQVIFATISTAGKLNSHLSPDFTSQPPLYNMVKVSGFDNGINGFVASRIELVGEGVDLSTDVPVGIRGTLTGVDVPGKAFAIGNLSVDYSGMPTAYMPTFLVSGLFINVQGLSSELTPGNAPSLTFVAPHLITRAAQGVPAHEGDHVTLVGYVSQFSGTLFAIEGTPVDGSLASLSGTSNAVLVQVDGIFSAGVVMASKITLL